MSMRKFLRMLLLLTVLSVSLALAPVVQPAQAAAPAGGTPVHVWLTDVSANQWVASQPSLSFQTQQATSPLTIKIDSTVKYQKITGFGAALTDSAAYLISELPASSRNTLMENLFSPSAGIGLNMVRSPMGAT